MKSLIHKDSLLTIAGLAGLAAAFLFVVYLPGRRELVRIDAEIAAAHAEISGVPARAAELDRLREEIARREQYLRETLARVPMEADAHAVVQDVARFARRANVTIARLEPLSAVPYAAYSTIPFRVRFSGGFEAIAQFLRELEQRRGVVKVESLMLSRESGGSGEDAQGVVDVAVYVRDFDFSDSAEMRDRTAASPSDTN